MEGDGSCYRYFLPFLRLDVFPNPLRHSIQFFEIFSRIAMEKCTLRECSVFLGVPDNLLFFFMILVI